jgi:hypothetical protein
VEVVRQISLLAKWFESFSTEIPQRRTEYEEK